MNSQVLKPTDPGQAGQDIELINTISLQLYEEQNILAAEELLATDATPQLLVEFSHRETP